MAAAWETLGATTAASEGTDITGGSNAKGTAVSLGTSSIAAKCLYLFCHTEDGTPFAIDIMTGGTPAVLVPDLLIDNLGGAGAALETYLFGPIPCSVTSSTEFHVRAECNDVAAGNEVVNVLLVLCDSIPSPELTSYTYAEYGVATGSTSKGTSIDPGATANTKGSWVEITPGSAAQASIQILILMAGSQSNSTMTNATWLVDLGTDGANPIVENLLFGAGTVGDQVAPQTILLRGDNFAGQQIYARAQCSINDATDRIITIQCLTIAGSVVSGGGGGGEGPMIGGRLVL